MTYNGKGVGKAYGFFGSRSPKNAVGMELDDAYGAIETPMAGLHLTEGMGNVSGDENLIGIAEGAGKKGINYMLEMKGPGRTNGKTAGMLADVLNQAYMSSVLKDMKNSGRAIVFEKNGEYVFRD